MKTTRNYYFPKRNALIPPQLEGEATGSNTSSGSLRITIPGKRKRNERADDEKVQRETRGIENEDVVQTDTVDIAYTAIQQGRHLGEV